MRKFWDPVVKPVLEAADARRLIEIGSETGGHTLRIARWCRRRGASLEVIDPKPSFDPETFDVDYEGARLHLALSLDVLGELLPADVVLIDGDHNWHTVFHEVVLCYGETGPLPPDAPILICHDVAWPYGRRDLYYDIDTIPPEGRQPSAIGALGPGSKGFVESGLNGMARHAEREGGPRNGVKTGIEDALAGRTDQVRIVWLDVFFGLAIIVPLSRLEAAPALAKVLDGLELSTHWKLLAALVEQERISGAIAIQRLHAFSGERRPATGVLERSFKSTLPQDVLAGVVVGMPQSRYRGRPMALNPFDMANYLQLIGDVGPLTIFEIGTWRGGRALWLADMLRAHGLPGRVICLDLAPPADLMDPRITLLQGDARRLADTIDQALLNLPHPWLVIEDSAHDLGTCEAVLAFFDPHLRAGDRIVIEDGISSAVLGGAGEDTVSGPSEAIARFLAKRGADYAIDTGSCDRFGYNVTFNPNGWLRRL